MPCDETTAVHGASCPGEIILGNPFLVQSGLNISAIAENIEHLWSVDYGNVHGDAIRIKIGKLGVQLLTKNPLAKEETSFSPAYFEEALRLRYFIPNGDFPLREGD